MDFRGGIGFHWEVRISKVYPGNSVLIKTAARFYGTKTRLLKERTHRKDRRAIGCIRRGTGRTNSRL